MRIKSLRPLLLGLVAAASLGSSGCGSYRGTATAYFTWQIADARDPNPQASSFTCEQKGVATIRLDLVTQSFDFDCRTFAGETFSIPSGDYNVRLLALGYNAQALSVIEFRESLFGRTNLGHIIFQVP